MAIKSGFLGFVKYSILILLILSCSLKKNAWGASLPQIRDLDVDPISISDVYTPSSNLKNEIDAPKLPQETQTKLRGGVSEVNCIINKAQLIRFDEPVKRVSVSNPEIADVVVISPREIQVNAKAYGTTSLIAWGEKGDPVFFDIIVGNNINGFLSAVKNSIPDKNLQFKFSNNSVVLSGKITSAIIKDKIKNIAEAFQLKFVDTTESYTPQVILEIKVVEASKSFTKTLSNTFGLGNTNTASGTSSATSYRQVLFNATNGLQFYEIGHNGNVALSNLLEKGIIKILAEPKLVSTNGSKAEFNAGQEVPIPTGYDNQTRQITFTYKKVGVNMEFTPTIYTDSRRISLHVVPEVSEIDESISMDVNGIKIYGFKARKTDTTVELQNNETLVIAGLLQKKDSNIKTQLPLIGDVPLLGDIFKKLIIKNNETELIIFVTPKIIDSNNMASGV